MYYDHENDVWFEWPYEPPPPPDPLWKRLLSGLLLCIIAPFYWAGIVLILLTFGFLLAVSVPFGIGLLLFSVFWIANQFVGS